MRWAEAALAAGALLAACAQAPAPADPTQALCSAAEQVLFHCSLGERGVSLCGVADGGRLVRLRALAGAPGRPDWVQEATAGEGARFSAATAALAPRATVRQLWFDIGAERHLLTQCVGGDCPYAAGLALLRGDSVVRQQRCLRTADDRAWFSPALGRFGEDASHSRAATPLLEFVDADLGVERLYPVRE